MMDASSQSDIVTWDEIERSESYLVAAMFDEAVSLASSILTRLCKNEHANVLDGYVLQDKIESAAMVLVQSLKGCSRTSDLLNDLSNNLGSITRIPAQVVLTGACIQVSDGYPSTVRDFMTDYLMKWRLEDGKYVATDSNCNGVSIQGGDRLVLAVDEYVELSNFYAITLLGTVLNDLNHAVTWVEKTDLPEENQQDLLRRLRSLCSLKSTSSPPGSALADQADLVTSVKESEKSHMIFSTHGQNQGGGPVMSVSKWSKLLRFFSCFPSVNMKFGDSRLIVSNGKILWGCLILLVWYFLRKKRDSMQRIARSRALKLKQGLVDIWQLAFSYQVNPLAAVQSLPGPAQRSL